MNRLRDLAGNRLGRLLTPVLVVLVLVAASRPGFAQPQPSEYDLKAAFLYQFTTFVEWPPEKFSSLEQPLVLGVVGARELADKLEQFSGDRDGAGRMVEVRRMGTRDDLDDVHVLFVDERITGNANTMLRDAASKSILTVTESAEFRPQNSIINFEIVDNKVRFDVSLALAQQSNLRISARMLQFALRVID